MSEKILLLEDDVSIASGLMYALEKEGYMPSHYSSIEKAKQAIGKTGYWQNRVSISHS